MSQNNSSRNKLVVPGAQNAIGPDTTARDNGSVGGEITKRLVEMGQSQMSSSNNYNQSK